MGFLLPINWEKTSVWSLPIPTSSAEDLAKWVARRSYWKSSNTWKTIKTFFGDHLKSSEVVSLSEEEFFALLERDDKASQQFHEDLESRFVLWGKATKSFLEFARRDLNLDQYEGDRS